MARRERGKPLRYPPPATCFSLPSSKRGGRTPTDADLTAALAHGARSAERARLSAFHHGSHLREYSSQRLGFRPGFLGRGLNGRYPPSPVPVQGCTSHPGHHAGRLMPKPPGSSLQSRPRAPPSLPCRGVPPRHVLHVSEDGHVTGIGTDVKGVSLKKLRRSSPDGAKRNPGTMV